MTSKLRNKVDKLGWEHANIEITNHFCDAEVAISREIGEVPSWFGPRQYSVTITVILQPDQLWRLHKLTELICTFVFGRRP